VPVQSTEPEVSPTEQLLPPPQVTPESAPPVRLQSLVPSQVTDELEPTASEHMLFAVHEKSQPEVQLPLQAVSLEQWVVQLVPQSI